MPNYVSKMGEWHAAKEKVGLTNKSDRTFEYKGQMIQPGEPFIYEGPCREAVKAIFESGQTTLGTNFKNDPEFLKSLQAYGYSSDEEGVKKYLKMIGFNEQEHIDNFNKQASIIKNQEMPKIHDEILVMGGGKSQTGDREADMIGGFGDQRIRKPEELRKK